MALDQSRWGPAVRAALTGLNVQDNEKITNAQLDQVWIAITGEHRAEITNFAEVLPDTLNNPVGQAILIPSTSGPGSPSSGATSAAKVIEGLGKVQ